MARRKSLESGFQDQLIFEIKQMLPGAIVLKIDGYQGFPDLLILYRNRWAALENKRNMDASHQPNQDYYVDLADHMSFARFVYPENKEEVLLELFTALGA